MHYLYTIEVEDEGVIEKLRSIAAENGISLSIREKIIPSNNSGSGERLAEALNKISVYGGLKSFGDASEWQREQRKDRNLTGRE